MEIFSRYNAYFSMLLACYHLLISTEHKAEAVGSMFGLGMAFDDKLEVHQHSYKMYAVRKLVLCLNEAQLNVSIALHHSNKLIQF